MEGQLFFKIVNHMVDYSSVIHIQYNVYILALYYLNLETDILLGCEEKLIRNLVNKLLKEFH